MKAKLIQYLKYLFFLGLGVFLVWLSLHQLQSNKDEWLKFKQALTTANYWLFIPVFFILSTSHILRALRWRLLIQPLGYTTSLPNTFFAVMIGYLANMAVPRLGEVLKCTVLAKYEKVPAEKIVGTIVAERAFDVICLGIVFILALTVQFEVVLEAYKQMQQIAQGYQNNNKDNNSLMPYVTIIALLVLLVWLIKSKKILSIISTIKKIIKGIAEGLLTATKLKNKFLFITYSVAIWLLYLLGTWIGFYATTGTEGLGLNTALSCLAFASIGMIITPGGIGAYAALLALVLTLQHPPIDNAIGYANGTLQWFAQCIIVLIVGFASLLAIPIYNKSKKTV
jgi:uncharacterized protein (TIRG00374 family)